MDTDSCIVHIKTENVYKDIADDAKKKYDKHVIKLTDH